MPPGTTMPNDPGCASRRAPPFAAVWQSHGVRETHTPGVIGRERPAVRALLASIVLAGAAEVRRYLCPKGADRPRADTRPATLGGSSLVASGRSPQDHVALALGTPSGYVLCRQGLGQCRVAPRSPVSGAVRGGIQGRWLADGRAPREFGWFAEVAQDALDPLGGHNEGGQAQRGAAPGGRPAGKQRLRGALVGRNEPGPAQAPERARSPDRAAWSGTGHLAGQPSHGNCAATTTGSCSCRRRGR